MRMCLLVNRAQQCRNNSSILGIFSRNDEPKAQTDRTPRTPFTKVRVSAHKSRLFSLMNVAKAHQNATLSESLENSILSTPTYTWDMMWHPCVFRLRWCAHWSQGSTENLYPSNGQFSGVTGSKSQKVLPAGKAVRSLTVNIPFVFTCLVPFVTRSESSVHQQLQKQRICLVILHLQVHHAAWRKSHSSFYLSVYSVYKLIGDVDKNLQARCTPWRKSHSSFYLSVYPVYKLMRLEDKMSTLSMVPCNRCCW